MDSGVGRVLDCLDKAGQRENTLVIFYSDNGAFMLKGRGLEVASNAPLRDGGVTLYEGGIRVPAVVRWPGRIEPGTVCREPLISLDLLPTILRAAAGELPDSPILDGHDVAAVLAGEAKSPHESLFFEFRGFSALRAGRYKLLRPRPDGDWALYDLIADLGETKDRAGAHPDLVRRLIDRFQQWKKEISSD